MTKKNKKYLAIGGVALLLLIIIFVFGKQIGKNENEDRQIDVSVNIEDANGNTSTYDPNPLLEKLNKGLTTTYFFNSTLNSERCAPIEELYALDSVRFMATVKGYKEKYGVSLITHMNGCYTTCSSQGRQLNFFQAIEQRIINLKDIIT